MATATYHPDDSGRSWSLGDTVLRHAVTFAWGGLSILFIICHLAGYSPVADLDDLLKRVEIRTFLQTGDWFDRTIPGIVQPEPFVSHWVRLVDLPYAAVAAPLALLFGDETALAVASFTVPLLLLWPALYFYRRIIGELEADRPAELFLVALCPAIPSFFEFAPDRIDYHNLEIVMLFASLWLTMDRRPVAAAANGVLVAFAFGIGMEFAPFYCLILAAYAADFIARRDDAGRRLGVFGACLASTALPVFLAIVPPGRYGIISCDTYSTPHLFALGCAGLIFSAAGYLSPRLGGIAGRAMILAVPAGVALAGLVYLFPDCHEGPFAAVSPYVISNWIGHILQDKSLFGRPDVILSHQMISIGLLLVGAAAMIVIGMRPPFRRNLVLFAAVTLLALLQGCFLLRYFRYVGFFANLGLILALATILRPNPQAGGGMAGALTARLPSAGAVLAPGLLLATVTFISYFVREAPAQIPASGAEFAGDCDIGEGSVLQWPQGASILSPPGLGIRILAAERLPRATIVATPHHRAWHGIERAYRFLDPRTPDPRKYLDQSKATHVAICAWRGTPLPSLENAFPLTARLVEGRPPDWLTECALSPDSPIRVYRYPAGGGAVCPEER